MVHVMFDRTLAIKKVPEERGRIDAVREHPVTFLVPGIQVSGGPWTFSAHLILKELLGTCVSCSCTFHLFPRIRAPL